MDEYKKGKRLSIIIYVILLLVGAYPILNSAIGGLLLGGNTGDLVELAIGAAVVAAIVVLAIFINKGYKVAWLLMAVISSAMALYLFFGTSGEDFSLEITLRVAGFAYAGGMLFASPSFKTYLRKRMQLRTGRFDF
ncbi:MAG: hypothetical protein IKD06_04170 [Clostridia bacterium]|nr:hypothetical protein [Clostridia bacterium]